MTLLASCDGGRIGTTWIGGRKGEVFSASSRSTRCGAIREGGIRSGGNVAGSEGDIGEIEMSEVADAIGAPRGGVRVKTVESVVADVGPLGEGMVGAGE